MRVASAWERLQPEDKLVDVSSSWTKLAIDVRSLSDHYYDAFLREIWRGVKTGDRVSINCDDSIQPVATDSARSAANQSQIARFDDPPQSGEHVLHILQAFSRDLKWSEWLVLRIENAYESRMCRQHVGLLPFDRPTSIAQIRFRP